MTKANLKKAITEMIETVYPDGGECVWDKQDEDMLDYYFSTYGKENELVPEHVSVKFSKGGYLTEVSVETWRVVEVVDEKNHDRIL